MQFIPDVSTSWNNEQLSYVFLINAVFFSVHVVSTVYSDGNNFKKWTIWKKDKPEVLVTKKL